MKIIFTIIGIYAGIGILFTGVLLLYSYIHDYLVDKGRIERGYMISRDFREMKEIDQIRELIKVVITYPYIIFIYLDALVYIYIIRK